MIPNKLRHAFEHDPQLKNLYKTKFDNEQGEILLLDLERQARKISINASDVVENITGDYAIYPLSSPLWFPVST